MSDPVKQLHGVVIRADGTVPFDDDVPEKHRLATLIWLIEQGHKLDPIPDTRHVKIRQWPPT